MLAGPREKTTVVTCTWAAPGQRENTKTVAKQYGTFYIGIAMVILPYFGPVRKLHFQFPLNLTYTNTKVGNMLKANHM